MLPARQLPHASVQLFRSLATQARAAVARKSRKANALIVVAVLGIGVPTAWNPVVNFVGGIVRAGNLELSNEPFSVYLFDKYEFAVDASGNSIVASEVFGADLDPQSALVPLFSNDGSGAAPHYYENYNPEDIKGHTIAAVWDMDLELVGDNLVSRLDLVQISTGSCPGDEHRDFDFEYLVFADLNDNGQFGEAAEEWLTRSSELDSWTLPQSDAKGDSSTLPGLGWPARMRGTLGYFAATTSGIESEVYPVGTEGQLKLRVVELIEIPQDVDTSSAQLGSGTKLVLKQVRRGYGFVDGIDPDYLSPQVMDGCDASSNVVPATSSDAAVPTDRALPQTASRCDLDGSCVLPQVPGVFAPRLRLLASMQLVNGNPYVLGTPVDVGSVGLFKYTITNTGTVPISGLEFFNTDFPTTQITAPIACLNEATQQSVNLADAVLPSGAQIVCTEAKSLEVSGSVGGLAIPDYFESDVFVQAKSDLGMTAAQTMLRLPLRTPGISASNLCTWAEAPARTMCLLTTADNSTALDSDCDGYSDADELSGQLSAIKQLSDPCNAADAPLVTPCSAAPISYPSQYAFVDNPSVFDWNRLSWAEYLTNRQLFDWDGDGIDDTQDAAPCEPTAETAAP